MIVVSLIALALLALAGWLGPLTLRGDGGVSRGRTCARALGLPA